MRDINREPTDEVDALVIGCGMAGGALVKRLSDQGVKVVCLEQGSTFHPLQLQHFSQEWEWKRVRDWNIHPNVRQWPEDYPVVGDADSSIRVMNAMGGTLNHWSAHFPRFKPVDFKKGTEHGLSPDWPLTYEDLAPYYDINERELGVAGLAGDPAYPPRADDSRMPPIPIGMAGRKLAEGFEKLGWHWWLMDNAILTRDHDGRLACNHCGVCVLGCPRGSIGNSALSYVPQALANGADIRPDCRVEQIIVKNGKAVGAVYIDLTTGRRHQQNARAVIVAGNAIGTARLLQMSANNEHPDGLANSSGQLGRNFMLHQSALVEGFFDEQLQSYKGARGAPLFSHEFYDTDTSRGFVNGFMMLMVRQTGAGWSAMGYSTLDPARWGKDHHDDMAWRMGRHAWLVMLSEDLPLESNTVTLDPTVTDSSGLPAPKVHWRAHPQDKLLTQWSIARGREAMEAAGATRIFDSGVYEQPPGYHLMGTARMGNDPATSVTNRWHQTWDVPNLFVCDGASFVTSASVNPTATIGALAVRLAHYLGAEGRNVLSQRAQANA